MSGKGSAQRPEATPGAYAEGYERAFAPSAQALIAAIRAADEASRCAEGVGLLYWFGMSAEQDSDEARLVAKVLSQ